MNLSDVEIGKKIKQYRKKKMTQQELATIIGKTESSIRKYEKGLVTIPLDVLEKIASALGITVLNLIGGEYWDKKYPDIAKKSKAYEGFIDYLNSLGYIVKDIYNAKQIPLEEFKKINTLPNEYEKSDFVSVETHCMEFTKDGKSFILEDDEFEKLQTDTEDVIALKLWQKSQKKNKPLT